MCWRSVVALVLLLASGATSRAQDVIKVDRVGLGGSEPSGTSAIIATPASIPANTAGQNLIFIDGSGLFRKGTLAKADLPATTVFTDQANTFGAFTQTFNGPITANANVTISGANDLILGTGGMRAGSGATLIRDVLDASTIASFGDAAIALNQPTTVGANLTVSGAFDTIVGTGGIRAGSGAVIFRNVADSSQSASIGDSAITLDRNTTVNGTFGATGNATFTLDVAVNGGDLTSSAATLNINSGGIINLQDRLTMASANSAGSDNWASWTTGWNCTYAGSCDVRHLQADELHVRLFIAELQEAHNGAELWVKSTAILDQSFACPASGGTVSIRVRDFPSAANMRVFSTGDYVLFRPMSRTDADTDGATDLVISECVGTVSAYVDGTAGTEGTQQWTFTRGTIGGTGGSMTASTNVPAENLALDFGVSGGGFLEATVNDGAEGVNGPYFQSVKWTGSPASAAAGKTVTSRFGKLTGITTTADEYGFIAGIYGATSTGQYVKASNLGVDLHGVDFTMWDGANQAIILRRGSGSAPYFGLGNPAPTTYASGSGVWMGDDGGTYKFRAGNPSARWFSIDDTSGLEFKSGSTIWGQFNSGGLRLGIDTAGNGNVYADTSGNFHVRSGTVNRITQSASNGNLSFLDDDGTTVRAQIGSSAAYFGGTSGARFQIDYGTAVRAYDSTNKQFFQIDSGNGLLLGDWYTADKSFIQLWPDGSQIVFCRNGGSSCPLVFSGTTGDITSYGNILLGSGGKITSTNNFTLGNAEGMSFQIGTSASGFDAPRTIRFLSGATEYGAIGTRSTEAIYLQSYRTGAGKGIRLAIGSTSTFASQETGLFITTEGSNPTILNIVAQQWSGSIGHNLEVQFVPFMSTPTGTMTSRLGTAANQWSEIRGVNFYANGTIGWSGSCATTVVVSGGIVTGCI
jgi:hypothetical protein